MAPAIAAGAAAAAAGLRQFRSWGEMHRLRLAHPFRFIPLLGRRYRFTDHAVAGSSATVMKTAHELTRRQHYTGFGSQARHISDLADADANYFLLLGGQDGWLGSSTFVDQEPLWRRGAYLKLPLRLAAVREAFPHRMVLEP
ncbi:MAG: penicillin acylase family protein [Alphaproteobacteria bacterium]|nr:penicillin acylase family protein [Alphaproteobacteria bacterium]